MLFDTSRAAKEQLEAEHKEHLGWLANALNHLRTRMLAGEMDEAAVERKMNTSDQISEASGAEQHLRQSKRKNEHVSRPRTSKGLLDASTDEDDDNFSMASTVVADEGSQAGCASRRGKRRHAAAMKDDQEDGIEHEEGSDSCADQIESGDKSKLAQILVPSKLRVVDLRRELRARGLPSSGLKAQLVEKLEAALEMEDLEGEKEPELPEILEGDEEENDDEVQEGAEQVQRAAKVAKHSASTSSASSYSSAIAPSEEGAPPVPSTRRTSSRSSKAKNSGGAAKKLQSRPSSSDSNCRRSSRGMKSAASAMGVETQTYDAGAHEPELPAVDEGASAESFSIGEDVTPGSQAPVAVSPQEGAALANDPACTNNEGASRHNGDSRAEKAVVEVVAEQVSSASKVLAPTPAPVVTSAGKEKHDSVSGSLPTPVPSSSSTASSANSLLQGSAGSSTSGAGSGSGHALAKAPSSAKDIAAKISALRRGQLEEKSRVNKGGGVSANARSASAATSSTAHANAATLTQPLSFLERLKLTTASFASGNASSHSNANSSNSSKAPAAAPKPAPAEAASLVSDADTSAPPLNAASTTPLPATAAPAPPSSSNPPDPADDSPTGSDGAAHLESSTGHASHLRKDAAEKMPVSGMDQRNTERAGAEASHQSDTIAAKAMPVVKNAPAPSNSHASPQINAAPSAPASGKGSKPAPSNLVGGLHSLTSLLKKGPAEGGSSSASSTAPASGGMRVVEVKALKRAEAARKADLVKEEERRQRKLLMERAIQQKKADATRLEQEAHKKRAELAAKRKEREEKLGAGGGGMPTANAAAASAASTISGIGKAGPQAGNEEHKKPRIDGLGGAPARGGLPSATAPLSSVPRPPNTVPNLSNSRPGAPIDRLKSPMPATKQASGGSGNAGSALKDISNKQASNASVPGASAAAAGGGSKGEYASKPGLSTSASQPHAKANFGSLAGKLGVGESYEISDREESSDDDYDSDGGGGGKGKAAAKRVPDWAKGPALREALEAQFNKKHKVDPDSIFPEVRTCDLEEIFKSYQQGGAQAKKRAYRQRQSTGNWQRDELSSAEKTRYREDMGYGHS
ncbi:hypothetical protein NSK_001853 [Nannochloropsis salina CCMP1776]|uniref:SAP domain-containing protein n=1 Tax=Nannochloropsis salina CCMP1776 TaxID=1027361 RepID=A0A4D9DBD2_9STRA|nr:hypothetical protein NSK_001853 [Nannochloropsis salina CCMP1776]|eukprot:TFJ86765.1 hypothetical protein NSK_001853 [Nannochloropsis salina CCMP1776]